MTKSESKSHNINVPSEFHFLAGQDNFSQRVFRNSRWREVNVYDDIIISKGGVIAAFIFLKGGNL